MKNHSFVHWCDLSNNKNVLSALLPTFYAFIFCSLHHIPILGIKTYEEVAGSVPAEEQLSAPTVTSNNHEPVSRPLIALVPSKPCKPTLPADEKERPRAIWEQPVCPPCPEPSGRPISYSRLIENAIVKIQPYGYIKWELLYDTRQTVFLREDNVLLFPQPVLLDRFGQDINDHGKWHMTAFETRIGLGLQGPEWCCCKTDGLIEGDFRGIAENTLSDFRLRHAFGRISWENGSFMFGQWWHPLWILECFPHTVAFSIGAPMDPQARDPQLRLTQRWDWFELIFAAASQRDFASPGPVFTPPTPNSVASPSTFYIREAVVPNLHLQTRAYFGKHLIGVAGDYKRLTPRLVSEKDVKVCEHIDSFIVEGFAAFVKPPWSLRMKGFWAQNGTDQLLISGYGVRTVDPDTDARTYSATAAAGGWLDFSYIFGCDNHELGFFMGGTKNLGSHDALFINPATGVPIIYALAGVAQNVDTVFRFAPRYLFLKDPLRFGVEVEYTRASWGRPNRFAKVINTCPVGNIHILFALYYVF